MKDSGYRVVFLRAAWNDLMALGEETQNAILDAIYKLEENPRPSGCKKLQGEPYLRIRVGDYRVAYEVEDDILLVLIVRVGNRREVYRKKK